MYVQKLFVQKLALLTSCTVVIATDCHQILSECFQDETLLERREIYFDKYKLTIKKNNYNDDNKNNNNDNFKYSCTTSCAITSHKRQTEIFSCQTLIQLEPLVNDYLLHATATTF